MGRNGASKWFYLVGKCSRNGPQGKPVKVVLAATVAARMSSRRSLRSLAWEEEKYL
jgi:hypothetical protein